MDEQEWLEKRKPNINSTDAAALFGLSKYKTLFQLWHEKKGNIDEMFTPNERVIIGQEVESGIAAAFSKLTGYDCEPFKDYIENKEARSGSSFDYIVTSGPYSDMLLEIKNVDYIIFRDEWMYEDEQNGEAPAHIEIQVQHQINHAKKRGAIILACVGGNSLKWFVRERDDSMINVIDKEIEKFWSSIDNNKEPSPNYLLDSASICALYSNATEDEIYQCSEDEAIEMASLIDTYEDWGNEIKKYEAMRLSLKAQILKRIGTASKVFANDKKIHTGRTKDSAGKQLEITADMIGQKITLTKPRKGYRMFKTGKLTEKKGAENVKS